MPIQALQSKHSDPSTTIQAHRSKHSIPSPSIQAHQSATSADPLSLSLLVCPCVGVFGIVASVVDFLFFWLIFDFMSVGVCVSKEEVDDESVGFADGEEREKKERN